MLHTLAAHNKRTARDAALSTLAKQAGGTDVGDNAVLQSVAVMQPATLQAWCTSWGNAVLTGRPELKVRVRQKLKACLMGTYCHTSRVTHPPAQPATFRFSKI